MGKRTHLQYIIFMWRLLLIISTKLAGNTIGKFRLSVENSKNRILHILQTRLDLECLVQHSTDRCPTGMPNSYIDQESNTFGGLSFSPLKCFQSVQCAFTKFYDVYLYFY